MLTDVSRCAMTGVIIGKDGKKVKRKCDGCTMCCGEIFEQENLSPAGEVCPNMRRGGCSIYASRPQNCREWGCYWLKDDSIPKFMKPNRCGFVMGRTPDTGEFCLYVDPKRPGAWKDAQVFQWLNERVRPYTDITVIQGNERRILHRHILRLG